MITIGSDPEFGLLCEDGRQKVACDVVPDSISAPIGVDGHNHIGELRPRYGDTPREHLQNIADLMVKLDEMVPLEYKIVAGSMVANNDAIGGHIHFGNLGGGFDRSLALRALDYYLALPVALIEVAESARHRHRYCNYGILAAQGNDGGWRRQDWGFEYRTLPSWLLGWGVALSILSTGYAIVDAVKRNSCPDVPNNIPDPNDFYDCNKEAMYPLLSKIKRGWRELPLYPEFRLEVAFLNHLLVQKMEWKEGQDVRDNWPGRRLREKWMKGFKIKANTSDENCARIIRLIEQSKKDLKVFVYGLAPCREFDVAISHAATGAPDSMVALQRFGRAADAEYNDWLCIGLSLDVRQDIERSAEIINRIIAGDLIPADSLARSREDMRVSRYPAQDAQGNWHDASGRYTVAPTGEGLPF